MWLDVFNEMRKSSGMSLDAVSYTHLDVYKRQEEAGVYFNNQNPDAPITAAQVKFFYAAAGRHGLTKADAKSLLRRHGCASAKDIRAKDFDAILADLDGGGNGEVEGNNAQ